MKAVELTTYLFYPGRYNWRETIYYACIIHHNGECMEINSKVVYAITVKCNNTMYSEISLSRSQFVQTSKGK